jgi:hypothetical protein
MTAAAKVFARVASLPWSQRCVAAVALVLCVWQVCSFWDVRPDDPFITYRYAQNLVNGQGLVFNPGARFLGATSPAHMLLAAPVYGTCGQELLPSVMDAAGCIAWSVQALCVYALLLPSVGILAASAVALLVDLGAAESFMWVSFETNIALAFALLALVVGRRERHALAAVLLGIATLFRPEMTLLAAIVFGSLLLQRARALWRAVVLFVCVVGSWVAFAAWYYGSPLPHSAVEKFQRATFTAYLEHAFQHLGAVVIPFGDGLWRSLAAWALWIAGVVVLARRDRALLILALFGFLHALVFTVVLRPFVEHSWHLYPFVASGAVFVAGALASLLRAPQRWLQVCAALALSGAIIATAARSQQAAADEEGAYWTGARDAVYRDSARFIRESLRPDEEFAAIEVGTLSYYSDRKAYDLGGLVTDLKTDPMANHPVRLLVLDKRYLYTAPPWPPLRVFSSGEFSAYVYRMPVRAWQSPGM